jgi:hypothetical protein
MWGQAQQKQKRAYATRKGKQAFEGLVAGETMVKMKKPGKKKALTANWEGPYLFVAHADGIGNLDFEEGSRICIIQDADGDNRVVVIRTKCNPSTNNYTFVNIGIEKVTTNFICNRKSNSVSI